jgi:hypothetical protein
MGISLLLHNDRFFRQYLPPAAHIHNYKNDILHEGRVSARRIFYYAFTFRNSILLANNTKTVGVAVLRSKCPCIM